MNAVFFPQAVLDILLAIGRVDVVGEELVLTREGYRYNVSEAMRVVREVAQGEDSRELCGRVLENEIAVTEHGAEILGSSMLIEDSAYDIVPGLIARPVGETDPAVASGQREEDVLRELSNLDEVREALA
jgi:hypothetical protein